MVSFERIDIEKINAEKVSSIGEVNIFQTLPWIDFIAKTQNAEPIVLTIISDGCFLGYFTGLIVKKYGLRVLGSPFRGWGTYFMGFNLQQSISYREILQAFPSFAFNNLKCHYLEIVDPNLRSEDCLGLPYRVEPLPWFALDLTQSEDELFASMKSQGRNNIRKSIKSGVIIEEASAYGFAEEYYDQYSEVLQKRSLVPTYSLETVRNLICQMEPTGNLLLLRARNIENLPIATGIFLAQNKTGVFWGAASRREYQSVRPNELLAWYGMKALKARGIQVLHLGGECEQYKEKLGCYGVNIYRLMKARNLMLDTLVKAVTSQKGSHFKNWALRRL